MARKNRRTRKLKHDPISALFNVGMLLRFHQSSEALEQLFRAATSNELPPESRRYLTLRAKVLRRSLSLQRRAEALALEGKIPQAVRKLRDADSLQDRLRGEFRVTFNAPAQGSLDLWESVVRGAADHLQTTRTLIYAAKQER